MVITPYGQVRLKNQQDIQKWLMAHKLEHRRLNMGGVLDGPVDGNWMLRHAVQHRVVGLEERILRLPGEWRTEQELQSWHLLHNRLHRKLGAG